MFWGSEAGNVVVGGWGDSANLDARLNEGKKERRDGKEVSIMERRKGRGEGRKKITQEKD